MTDQRMICPPKDRAPFDQGSLLHHPCEVGWQHGGETSFRRREIEWRDIKLTYEMTLTLDSGRRGRSAAYLVWTDEVGNAWPMFLTHLQDVLRNGVEPGGIVTGKWRVRKRGQNYGVALALT